jgi:hypothetical protein
VVSLDRSLLKGEAPRFSAEFNHPFFYEKHNIITMSDINIHSAIFKLKQHGNGNGNRNERGNGNGHGNRNGN